MESSSEPLGLIAGSSQMPLVVAREAARAGRLVTAAAIRGISDPTLDAVVDDVRWLDWGDLPAFLALLERWRERGVAQAIMAGKVEQQRIYDPDAADAVTEVLADLPTGHTDQLLGAVAGVLASAGIELLESTLFLGPLLATAGTVAGRDPSEQERADVDHGWQIAKALGTYDIGQTVVVKDRAVIAVEGMEGTDACIERAAALAGPGTVIVKTAKPNQDLRFDVPVIGAGTVRTMVQAGATVLAIEADLTVIFDRADIERTAVDEDLAIVARHHG